MTMFVWRDVVPALLAGCVLAVCGNPAQAAGTGTVVTGVADLEGPFSNAVITVVDAGGHKKITQADILGRYTLNVEGMVAPLMISAVEPGNSNCSDSAKPWAHCLGALLAEVSPDKVNVANVNALTDRAVGSVAKTLKLVGPQELIDTGTTAGIKPEVIHEKTDASRPSVLQALKDAGVTEAEHFDPVTTPMQANGKGVDAVLRVLVHNRGYDNNSGQPGGTSILDADYHYVGNDEPLDLQRGQIAVAEAEDPSYVRVLIVGDSTASTYEGFRFPRMGWGQVFQDQFKPDARVKVLNNAKSGRSSRNFYNQGYFRQMAQYLRPGDYVIINHGHNDQNCDSKKPKRGAADVANLCTYPNDAAGHRQFPAGHPEMSFESSLEVYIQAARAKGAIPIIMTPTTRIKNAERKTGFPVVHSHYTTPTQGKGGFAFTGDYSQTIKDTARDAKLPLIDLEARTIAFANAHEADWTDYWLAIDPVKYPYYAKHPDGSSKKPDTTHFQEKGARAVAAMVAQGIKETPELSALAARLK